MIFPDLVLQNFFLSVCNKVKLFQPFESTCKTALTGMLKV